MNIPLNINLQQILLHLFNFVILAFGLYFLLYKPVKDFMAKREALYRSMKDDAEASLSRARELEEKYRGRLDAADEEIADRRRKAQAEAEAQARLRSEEAEAEAGRILARARAGAEAEKEKIIESARDEVSELAISAMRKLVSENLSQAYDEFLSAAERSGE